MQRVQVPGFGVVEFPDGMSDDDMAAAIKRSMKPDPTEGMSTGELFLAGTGKAMTDLARGVGQWVGAVNREDVQRSREQDAPLMNRGAAKVGHFAGNVASMLPAAFIPGANTYAGAATIGSLFGAAQPSVSTSETILNTGLGGLGGLAGQKLANVIGNFVRTGTAQTAGQQEATKEAARLGIKLTPGQATGSKALQKVEAALESNPMTSRPFDLMREANQRAYNTAAARQIGEVADNLNPAVLGRANDRLGQVFAKVADDTPVPLDPIRIGAKLSQVADDAEGLIGGNASLSQNPLFQRLDAFVNDAGGATREQLRNLSSKLGKAGYNNMTGQAGDRELGKALFRLKDVVDEEVMGTLSGAARKEFGDALKQWRALSQLTARTNVLNPSTGNVNPRALAGLLQQKDKAGFTFGGNTTDMYGAARVAQAFPEAVGNSGTATRSMGPADWLASLPTSLLARAYLSGPSGLLFQGTNSGTKALLGAGARPELMLPLGTSGGLLGAGLLSNLGQ